MLSAGIGLVPAFLTRDLIDSIPWNGKPGPHFSLTHLYLLVAGMVIIPIVTGVIGVAQTWSSNRVGQEVMHDLRASVYRHLQRLSLAFFTRTRTGEVQSRIANDIGGVDTVVTTTATSIASNVTTVLATAVALVFLDWRLALAAFALLPIFVLMTRKIGRVRREIASTKQGSLADISSLVEESLSVSGVLLGKTMGKGGELDGPLQPGEPAPRRARAAPAHGRPLDDGLDPGDLLDHAGARLRPRGLPLLQRQRVDLDRHPGRFHGAADAPVLPRRLAAQRAGGRADVARAVRPRVRVSRSAGRDRRGRAPVSIRAESCAARSCSTTSTSRTRRASRRCRTSASSAEAGTRVAIVGETGSGKTTLGYLVARLYDVTGGSIRIDDVDVRELSFKTLREAVGVVSQETYLFHGTVMENLRFARPDASDDEVHEAARAARIHDHLMTLPNGYDTIVGERGYRFSGGEKQRMAIARAILRDPPILVLDEATSALDVETERAVAEALDRLSQGRTTIAIAHRLSTVRDADQILVLDAGRLIERGTHADLVAQGGRYAALVDRDAVGMVLPD